MELTDTLFTLVFVYYTPPACFYATKISEIRLQVYSEDKIKIHYSHPKDSSRGHQSQHFQTDGFVYTPVDIKMRRLPSLNDRVQGYSRLLTQKLLLNVQEFLDKHF